MLKIPVTMKSSRDIQLFNLLNSTNIDLKELKKLCIDGCPDSYNVRSKVWKYLLNYLSTDTENQRKNLQFCRSQYENYVKEFVVESCENGSVSVDHPLNSEPTGNWITFFKDNEVLSQINKDCQRLCPDFDFFRRQTEYPSNILFGDNVPIGVLRRRCEMSCLQSRSLNQNLIGVTNMIHSPIHEIDLPHKRLTWGLKHHNISESESVPGSFNGITNSSNQEPHWEVIERILYVYYKTHTSQGYVQGMNEIIAPLYYVFANDPNESWRKYAEMDAFYCFNNLMTEIHPNFIRKLDGGQSSGIGGQMKVVTDLLSKFDFYLFKHLSHLDLLPEYFAFRWLSLLLAREFLLPDVLLLWDALFSDPCRFNLLPYICCSMLILIRNDLLKADFPTAVQLVQNYPPNIQLNCILLKARSLYALSY